MQNNGYQITILGWNIFLDIFLEISQDEKVRFSPIGIFYLQFPLFISFQVHLIYHQRPLGKPWSCLYKEDIANNPKVYDWSKG